MRNPKLAIQWQRSCRALWTAVLAVSLAACAMTPQELREANDTPEGTTRPEPAKQVARVPAPSPPPVVRPAPQQAAPQSLKDKYDTCVNLLGAAECTDLKQRLDVATRTPGPPHERLATTIAPQSSSPPVVQSAPQQAAPSSEHSSADHQIDLATAPRPQVVLRNELEQPANEKGSSSADGFAALAVAVLDAFAASKAYGTAPAPVFVPPSNINVHCTSQALGGGIVTTSCN